MRTLITVIILFALLCAGIVFNYLYINNVSNDLFALADSLDHNDNSQCEKTLNTITTLWEKSSDIFSISVNYKDVDYLGETILSLTAAFENKNEQDFERYRLLLIDAIDGVCRLEKLTLFNII